MILKKKYKTALITGAASGIGFNILKRLSKEGITILAVDQNKDKLNSVCKETNAKPLHLDLTDTKKLYKMLSNLQIDILISNAGTGKGINGILNTSPEDIELSTKINVEAHFHVFKALIPNMLKNRKGHIILIGSLAGLYPIDSAIYGGQKGAIHKIAQSLRVELSGSRIKLTEICPGRTRTEFANNAFNNKDKAKEFMSGFSILEPDDISDAILFSLNSKWRANISLIEISGTEQSPGGIPIYPVKDPILD